MFYISLWSVKKQKIKITAMQVYLKTSEYDLKQILPKTIFFGGSHRLSCPEGSHFTYFHRGSLFALHPLPYDMVRSECGNAILLLLTTQEGVETRS